MVIFTTSGVFFLSFPNTEGNSHCVSHNILSKKAESSGPTFIPQIVFTKGIERVGKHKSSAHFE